MLYLSPGMMREMTMYRKIMDFLVAWKNSKYRKPLILQGARQVGKTWLMKEFGKVEYKNYVYVSFDRNTIAQELFSKNIDIFKILLI